MATDVESKSALLKLQGGTSEAVVCRRVLKAGSLGAVHTTCHGGTYILQSCPLGNDDALNWAVPKFSVFLGMACLSATPAVW
jgi:hypothetical protein